MKKKFVSALCGAVLMLMQLSPAHAAKVFNTDELFEAEDTSINNGMIFYTPQSDLHSGRGAVYSYGKAVSDPDTITAEDLTFMFSVPEDGKYHIYMRVNCSDSQAAFFYKIDDGKWNNKNEGGRWEWIDVEYAELTKGVHKFSYNHSAIDGDVDAFFITDAPEKLPKEEDGEDVEEEDDEAKYAAPYGKVIHEQSEVPVVTGNGILIEAEDMKYTDWYTTGSNKQASGGKVLRAVNRYGSGSSDIKNRVFQTDFIADKAGIYIVWVRAYADGANKDSYYAG